MWATFDSNSKNFFILLQLDSTLNSDPLKNFLNFPISHLAVSVSTTKLCLEFSSDDTVDLEMK